MADEFKLENQKSISHLFENLTFNSQERVRVRAKSELELSELTYLSANFVANEEPILDFDDADDVTLVNVLKNVNILPVEGCSSLHCAKRP